MHTLALLSMYYLTVARVDITRGSAMAEGPREALVSRNPATTKHLT